MMMNAYNNIYLNDIEENLGNLFSYAICDLKLDASGFYDKFVFSNLAKQIEINNPKYVNMPCRELAEELDIETKDIKFSHTCFVEYWIGYMLAYYSYVKDIPFRNMKMLGLDYEQLEKMYIYHEAPMERFVLEVDKIIEENRKVKPTNLSIYRKRIGYSQNKLSKMSNVSLRMIQLYEQKQNDISMASVKTVWKLAKALKCNIEDLVEY